MSNGDTQGSFRWALWGDVPAVLDSIWRRVEFYSYRPGKFVLDPGRPLGSKLDYKRIDPAYSFLFLVYALLTVFVMVGPTINTFCGLWGWPGLLVIKCVVGLVALGVSVLTVVRFRSAFGGRLAWRFEACRIEFSSEGNPLAPGPSGWKMRRERTAKLILTAIGLAAAAPPIVLIAGWITRTSVTDQCSRMDQLVWPVVWQLALIMLIPLFASRLMRRYRGFRTGDATDPAPLTPSKATLRTCQWSAGLWSVGIASTLPWALSRGAIEARPGPYLQTTWIILLVLVLFLLWARRYALRRASELPDLDLPSALANAELLTVLEDPNPPPPGRIGPAIVTGVGLQPLMVLLLPAMFALTVPRSWLWWFVVPYCLFSGLVATYGALRPRWGQVVEGLRRWFFLGLPLPISIVVIVLAFLRVFNEQYVTTVIEAAPIGTITTTLAVAYLAAWFFEIWINRWMAEALLRRFGASDEEIARGFIERKGVMRANGYWTVAQQFVLYVHGPGRFGVQGWQEKRDWEGQIRREERFASYTYMDLFAAVVRGLKDGPGYLEELQRQLRAYYYALNVGVALAAVLLIMGHNNWAATPARMTPVIASSAPRAQGVDLAARISGSAEPALLVAASGGGTRAALYAAHALRGLQDLGLAHDIVLLSGASGGGAALAAFAEHYDELTQPPDPATRSDEKTPWGKFETAVTAPFISDVLDGMNELRIANGVSMGQLLVESMERRLYDQHHFGDLDQGKFLGHPALILNSTITGHPAAYSAALDGRAAWRDTSDPCAAFDTPFGWLAGERLVYTNLGDRSFALSERAALPDVNFRFTVVNDPAVELAQAAALNANFPPVFPNAKVTIAHADRDPKALQSCVQTADAYFVTDGGATENLSLISALVVLRNTLAMLTSAQWQTLRPLHVVAIEASAVDYEYTQDRGIGASTGGAKERLAGGVTELLVDSIDEMLKAHDRPELALHFVPLPLAFRSRGGFGTHWMYAQTIRITNPLPVKIHHWYWPWPSCGEGGCRVTLGQKDIAVLWSALFQVHGGFCDRPIGINGQKVSRDALTVQRWVCGGRLASDPPGGPAGGRPDLQVEEWGRLVKRP
jgi:hypothetical protein